MAGSGRIDRTGLLVGRSRERAALERRLASAATGSPGVVLVHGPAGIGKTALVRQLVSDHSSGRLLWASGDPAESMLTFGVLSQLQDAVGAASGSARDSPRVAGLSGPRPGDHLAAGANVLELLGGLGGDAPVLLVVDDTPWADRFSVDALVFALRRLRVEPVLAVFTARDSDMADVPDSLRRLLADRDASDLPLGGLGELDVLGLAGLLGKAWLDLPAARRLAAQTGGNPLYLRAMLDELDPATLSHPGQLAGPLPAPRAYSASVLARLAGCSSPARQLACALSVLGLRAAVGVTVRLAGLDDPVTALDEAVRAGLVDAPPGAGEIRFSHPLVQAAIYHGLLPAQRRVLHLNAAVLAGSQVEVLRHRIAAAVGEDPVLARDVAGFARLEAGRGAFAAASGLLLTASRLCSSPAEQDRLFLDGVEQLLLAGDGPAAAALRPQVELRPLSLRREYLLGLLSTFSGDPASGATMFERVWTLGAGSADHADHALAAKAALQLGRMANNDGRYAEVIEWSRRAAAPAAPAIDAGVADQLAAIASGALGRGREWLSSSAGLPRLAADYDGRDLGILIGRGVVQWMLDDLPEAITDLLLADSVARRVAPLYLRMYVLYYLSDAEFRFARWDESQTHSELAIGLCTDASYLTTLSAFHALAAYPAAGRGCWDQARHHITAAEAIGATLRDAPSKQLAATARALLARAQRDGPAMLESSAAVWAILDREGHTDPGGLAAALLYPEALISAGRLDEAAAALEQMSVLARRSEHPTGQLIIGRLSGLLAAARGHRGEAGEIFADADTRLRGGRLAGPFERALFDLDRGALARRAGHRREAARHLQAAHATFVRLAAAPFLTRCERELLACGLTPARRASGFQARLSPQEHAVATLVSAGHTNKEVAAQLVVSLKTVEYHLGNIFIKTGVKTRSQLTAHLTAPGTIRATNPLSQP